MINRREGDAWRLVANYGFPPEFEAHFRSRGLFSFGNPNAVAARAASECRPVHIHDVTAVPGYPDASIRLGRQRTSLGVPLLREGEVIGTIVLARQRVEPFTDRQIELVSTFADQAVIAMENARLITEQHEALERQTATAEVLQVINASPGDLTPVFDAILEKAHSLCGAAKGTFIVVDGDQLRLAASRGLSEAFVEVLQRPRGYERGSPPEQLLNGAAMIHLVGPAISDGSIGRVAVELEGIRAVLFVPLRRHGALLGYITAYRQEEAAFSEKQIALLQSFAAQAVIAMENARLLTEQREALEQQTATAEVLQVINASPGNLTPVFDVILKKAHILCGAEYGVLLTYDGELFWPAAV